MTVWNASNSGNDNCPFDDSHKASLGPAMSHASQESYPQRVAGEGLGFGVVLRENTGGRGTAENYMHVYVR